MHIRGDLPRRSYYSDNQTCLDVAARLCLMTPEKSLPGVSKTNAIGEANNKTIISDARKAQYQAGFPACWWPYAAPCVCMLKNAMLDINNESAYYDTHGEHFPGKLIPFGCLVYYVPSPTRDGRHKMENRLCTGVFMGYRTAPGCKWNGDYLVADLNDFSGLSLAARSEPGIYKHIVPHITKTVKWTPSSISFPLFERFLQHNETLEGLEDCKRQLKRERARRKREELPPLSAEEVEKFRTFAKFSKKMEKPDNAGFEQPPLDPISMDELEPIETTEEGMANEDPEDLQSYEEMERSMMLRAFLLKGAVVEIVDLKGRSHFNGKLARIENWDNDNRYFEARLKKSEKIVKLLLKNVRVLNG